RTIDARSMCVLPDGVMLNYLMRVPSPVPFVTFLPTDVLMYREDRMLDALNHHPPDMIVLIPRDTTDYGAKTFGRDYAQSLYGWINQHYQRMIPTGEPFE